MSNVFQFKRRFADTTTPTTSNLSEGEVAFNFGAAGAPAAFIRDDSNNILRLGLIEGSGSSGKVARHDGTKWTIASGVNLDSSGNIVVANLTADEISATTSLDVDGDAEVTGTLTVAAMSGDGSGLTDWVGDTSSSTPQARTSSGWVDSLEVIDDDTVKTQPTKMEVLTATEYGLITPDSDTLYLLTLV